MERITCSLVVAIALIVGCRGQSNTSAGSAAADADPQASTQDVARAASPARNADAVVDVGSELQISKDDPSKTGWQSEAFSDSAGTQLKHLGEILANSGESKYKIDSIVADACSVPQLRPEQLEPVYDDSQTLVRRTKTLESQTDQRISATELESLVRNNLHELGIVSNIQSKFKIFDVLLRGDEATTRVYVHFSGTNDSGRAQMNATWLCAWTDIESSHPKITSVRLEKYEEVAISGTQPAFADKTRAVFDGPVFREQLQYGVDHWLDRIAASMSIDIGGWQGLAIGDVNGDDLEDVYICQPGGLPNRLYVQNVDGSAREVSAEAGVDWVDSSHGALIVDFDNDGDQDLAVGVPSGVVLMANDGSGKFIVAATKVLPAALPYSLAAADYDQDGDLDLFVCCYNRRGGVNQHLLFARPIPYHDANNGGRNVLLRNDATPANGKWQFSYATGKTGLDQMNNRRFSYAAAWEDFDDDGDLDIYIANDFGRNNLYRNDNGKFVDVAPSANVEDIGPGMSACWGDYDNDGRMDLYVSNMFSSAGNRITGQSQFQATADTNTRGAFRRHARCNSLFRNLGDGKFRDVSVENGVDLGRWAWGSRFADINNDGWQDLIVTNGFITQEDTGDL
ncbi:MAG: VCBS repeat-containing protein [Planctomycetales bacterium]|nr:VCBS repeat-containing protein [Planctomycetales bacterium]